MRFASSTGRRWLPFVGALGLALGGVVFLGSPPASAATSCADPSGTATVTLGSDTVGGVTSLSQDSSRRLVVDGTVCGASFPNVIDLEVASGAAPQTVRLDQNGGGGVFPCSTSIAGNLRSIDVVEVDGGPRETLSAGSTGSGSGVDLASCGNPGTINGLGMIRLVAGTGALTLSAAGGSGFAGPLAVPDVLEAADGSSQTLLPGAAANTIDFSRVSSPVTVNVSGGQVGSTANQTATTGSGAVDTFTGFGSQPISFIGSSSAATTYDAGSVADSYAGGDPGNDTLDFAHTSGSSLRICTAAINGCAAGVAQLGAVSETFSDIADFVGLAGGNTTFVSSGVGGHQLTGLGAGNVVDATPAGAGASVDAANGLVTAAGTGTPDRFSGASAFVGASAGGTTFVAGSTSETFADAGAAAGDAVDFSHVAVSPSTRLTVNVSGAPVGSLGNDTAGAGGATYNFAGGGAGISAFSSAGSGDTTFDVGPTGGYTLTGQGAGNVLSAAAVTSAATIDTASGSVSGLTSGGSDTVRGLSTFTSYVGPSAGGTKFVAGANDADFMSAGGSNTVDLSQLTSPVAVNVSGNQVGGTSTGTATSGAHTYSFTSFAGSPTTFVGSASAATTFDAGPVADTYTGGGTGGDTLDFSHSSSGSVLELCVVAGSGCTAGQAVLGTTSETFSGVSRLLGLATGNTYFATGDSPGYSFTGFGAGNRLDLRAATAPVVDLPDGLVTGLASAGQDTFAGILQFNVGLHPESSAPANASVGGSYHPVVDGTGSSNPVVLTVDPSSTNAACSLDGSGSVLFQHVGRCVLDANQQGDSHFATAAQLTQSFSIAPGSTQTDVSVAPHTLTATVAPIGPHGPVPTGTVSFTVDGVAVGSQPLDSSGVATLPYTVPTGSDHVVLADYSGDADLTASAGSVDRHDPTVTAHLSSAHARTTYGWYRSPVTVSFTCTPHGSPLVSTCPSPVLLNTDGVGQSASGSVDAEDGGHGSVTASAIDIDQIAPRVSVQGVTSGAHYAARAPKASCTGLDTLSGTLGCSVHTITKATTAGWDVSYTALAPDRAGNVGTKSGSYVVARYGVSGTTYSHGYWQVRLRHRYAVLAVSKIRPTLVGPVPGNQKPSGHPAAFHRTATVHGLPMWSTTIRIASAMRHHPTWSYGVEVGSTKHVVRVRLA